MSQTSSSRTTTVTLPLLEAVQHLLSLLQHNAVTHETLVRFQIVTAQGVRRAEGSSLPSKSDDGGLHDSGSLTTENATVDHQPKPNHRLNVRPQPPAAAATDPNAELQRRWTAVQSSSSSCTSPQCHLDGRGPDSAVQGQDTNVELTAQHRTEADIGSLSAQHRDDGLPSPRRAVASSPPRRGTSTERRALSVDPGVGPHVPSPSRSNVPLGRWQNTMRVQRDAYGVVAVAVGCRQSPRSAWLHTKDHRRRNAAAQSTPTRGALRSPDERHQHARSAEEEDGHRRPPQVDGAATPPNQGTGSPISYRYVSPPPPEVAGVSHPSTFPQALTQQQPRHHHAGTGSSVPRYHPLMTSAYVGGGFMQSKNISPPRSHSGTVSFGALETNAEDDGNGVLLRSGRRTPPPAAVLSDSCAFSPLPYDRAMRHPLLD